MHDYVIEAVVDNQIEATPEAGLVIRLDAGPYQAGEIDDDRVLATVALYWGFEDATPEQEAHRFPRPEDTSGLLAMMLERDGDSWLWADPNAYVDPALIHPRC